jgi:hypothetical protein
MAEVGGGRKRFEEIGGRWRMEEGGGWRGMAGDGRGGRGMEGVNPAKAVGEAWREASPPRGGLRPSG